MGGIINPDSKILHKCIWTKKILIERVILKLRYSIRKFLKIINFMQ